jgi:hypothetical protein
MGYRSEWAFAVRGSKENRQHFLDFLYIRAAAGEKGVDIDAEGCEELAPNHAQFFLQCQDVAEDEDVLLFHHEATKECSNWLKDLLRFARETLSLEASYVRLGDDPDDIVQSVDSAVPLSYVHRIDLSDLQKPKRESGYLLVFMHPKFRTMPTKCLTVTGREEAMKMKREAGDICFAYRWDGTNTSEIKEAVWWKPSDEEPYVQKF